MSVILNREALPFFTTGIKASRPNRSAKLRNETEALASSRMQPMSLIDDMIRQGWGDVPQTHIPANWRIRRGPGKINQ